MTTYRYTRVKGYHFRWESLLSGQKNLQISNKESVDNDREESPLDVDDNQLLEDAKENVKIIPIRSKRQRKTKSCRPDFPVYLVEGTRDKISSSLPYLFNVEGDPLTFSDAMSSQDNAFWKEAIDDEMQSFTGIILGY